MVSSLSELPLFAGLSAAECGAIERRMQRRDFAPQSVIVREGAQGDAAFLVLSGSVAVRRKDPESGVEFVLAEHPGVRERSRRRDARLHRALSYHFRFAVLVPMQTTSGRLSAFRSATAHPAPAMPPSSIGSFTQASSPAFVRRYR